MFLLVKSFLLAHQVVDEVVEVASDQLLELLGRPDFSLDLLEHIREFRKLVFFHC